MNSLAQYIRQLIANDNIVAFYNSTEWHKLRAEVLKERHYECQHCKAQGKLVKAITVHHINHVDEHPELALSKYYIDDEGNRKSNLVALCNECHNEEHKRFLKAKPLNEEWFGD